MICIVKVLNVCKLFSLFSLFVVCIVCTCTIQVHMICTDNLSLCNDFDLFWRSFVKKY